MKLFVVAVIAMCGMIGRIDAQLQAGIEAMAKQLDKNSNGFIEKEEFGLGGLGGAGDAGFTAMLTIGDSNKDGKLSISEFATYTASAGSAGPSQADQDKASEAIIDTNKDGYISKDEMAVMMGGKMDENAWKGNLMRADKNGDGKISWAEFKCADPSNPNAKGCNGAGSLTAVISMLSLVVLSVLLF